MPGPQEPVRTPGRGWKWKRAETLKWEGQARLWGQHRGLGRVSVRVLVAETEVPLELVKEKGQCIGSWYIRKIG